jgi:cytochrome o ubiquinol oxidase subunit 1
VHERDPFWAAKQEKRITIKPHYEEIHMPRNTGTGFYIGSLSFFFGFGMVWNIWWMVAVTGVWMLVCLIARLYDQDTDYHVSVEEIEEIENKARRQI